MTTVRRILAVSVAALALALLPQDVRADDPLITEEPSYVVPPLVCVSTTTGPETCSTTDPLTAELNARIGPVQPVDLVVEPSVDIVQGDVTTKANELAVSLTMADLDAEPAAGQANTGRDYAVLAHAGTLRVALHLWQRPGSRNHANVAVFDPATHRSGTWAVAVDIDRAADTITWRVPLPVLDDLRAQACPACAPLGRGSVLQSIRAITGIRVATAVFSPTYSGDEARASRAYTVGDR